MIKTDTFLPTIRMGKSGTGNMHWRHWPALLLSLAIHFFLMWFVYSHVRPHTTPRSDSQASGAPIRVSIVAHENSADTSIPQRKTPDVHTSPEEQPRISAPPADPLPPDTSPFSFDAAAPSSPRYFQSSALTEKPRVSSDIPPDLGSALDSQASGTAIFRLQINEEGAVDNVIVDESSFSESDQIKLIEAFQKIQFKPGNIDGVPVKSELRIEVTIGEPPPSIASPAKSRTTSARR